VYAIAPLAVLHFWWMVKADVTEPAIYAVILAFLLGYRVFAKLRDTRRRARRAPSRPAVQAGT
jgi:sulfoxide reductase heme-binding subunit YedZ